MSPRSHLHCPRCRAVFAAEYARCPADGAPLEASERDPRIGRPFADRYFIEDYVDEGASARVYRARHHRVSRRFAIKVLFGEHALDEAMRARFFREAEVACGLEHENLVSVLDVGETGGAVPYLVMDWIEGGTLLDVILREAPMARPRALDLVRQLVSGLAHAHGRGLVHRDFKPENVLVTREGVCKIVDFGLAVAPGRRPADARLTSHGIALGTPAYMAPEQALGAEVDSRCDQYALGVILYEMLSGRPPFAAVGVDAARLHISAPVPAISQRVPGLVADPDLEALAMRLLAKRPEDRFPDTAALLAYVEGLPDVGPGDAEVTQPMSSDAIAAAGARRRARVLTAPLELPAPRRGAGLLAGLGVGVAALGAIAFLTLGMTARGGAAGPAPEADEAIVERAGEPDSGEAAPRRLAFAGKSQRAAGGPVSRAASLRLAGARVAALAPPPGDAAEPAPPAPIRPRVVARPRPRRARAAGPVPRSRAAAPTELPEAIAPADDFEARYQAIGRRLRRAGDGDPEAARWVGAYLAIPFHDALRKPALRAESLATLGRIERALDALGGTR